MRNKCLTTVNGKFQCCELTPCTLYTAPHPAKLSAIFRDKIALLLLWFHVGAELLGVHNIRFGGWFRLLYADFMLFSHSKAVGASILLSTTMIPATVNHGGSSRDQYSLKYSPSRV